VSDDQYYSRHGRKRSKEDHTYLGDKNSQKRHRKEIIRDEKPKNIWPPPFEVAGASYVFDRGLFYEETSNFFYDPKTKLYYGNKQQAYFRHCPDKKPPFVKVDQDENKKKI